MLVLGGVPCDIGVSDLEPGMMYEKLQVIKEPQNPQNHRVANNPGCVDNDLFGVRKLIFQKGPILVLLL